MSPYTYCANNPVKLVDPNGMWIPGLDEDGNVTYTAEKGDNYKSFALQFSCGGKEKDIFKNAGYGIGDNDIKKGDIIKGDAVQKAIGSDVLKGKWNNMTETQKASQIMFAIKYGERHKTTVGDAYAFDLNDFVTGFYTSSNGLSLSNVTVPSNDGKNMIVNMSIWPKSGLENSEGQIPIYYGAQSSGDGYTLNYHSAKNLKARCAIPAIQIRLQ